MAAEAEASREAKVKVCSNIWIPVNRLAINLSLPFANSLLSRTHHWIFNRIILEFDHSVVKEVVVIYLFVIPSTTN